TDCKTKSGIQTFLILPLVNSWTDGAGRGSIGNRSIWLVQLIPLCKGSERLRDAGWTAAMEDCRGFCTKKWMGSNWNAVV
ncbi:hypothetical protein XENOCAPTIV_023912, partial [Xenoophorus captivus]